MNEPNDAIPDPSAPACTVCGHRTPCDRGHKDGYHLLECSHCGHRLANPMPSENELADLYRDQSYFGGEQQGGYHDYDGQTEPTLPAFEDHLVRVERERPASVSNPLVIDIGCAYGNHLAIAARRGWRAFGVEVSDHARAIARRRLADRATVVFSVSELPPEPADLIVFNDVIEHFPDPYSAFHQLFTQGCIGMETRLYLTTPNAGSTAARNAGVDWPYFHPPIHLQYFTPRSLRRLLDGLRFDHIEIAGLFPDDGVSSDEIDRCAALKATARGSDFREFMKERFVPGTWSRLTSYEHVPRYQLAARLAPQDARMLDFGCGSGFGSSLLAASGARSVLAVDIDPSTIHWARERHGASNLTFKVSEDLGATLPDGEFDIICCFEVIEHLGPDAQGELLRNLSRTLSAHGMALISTPNPTVTALYEENPYHVTELDQTAFEGLLGSHFKHVTLLAQQIAASVRLVGPAPPTDWVTLDCPFSGAEPTVPLRTSCWIGICSHRPVPPIPGMVAFDQGSDYVASHMQRHEAWTKLLERLADRNC